MPNTTYLSLPYPALSNAPNVPQDMQNLAAGVDGKLVGVITCTSGTRPTSRDGAMIYETDTKRYMTYSSSAAAWTTLDSNEPTFARKPSTQTVTSSTTLVADTALLLPVQANATYKVELAIAYGGAAAGDLKVLIRCPTSATFQGYGLTLIPTAASQQEFQVQPYSENTSGVWGVIGAGTQYGWVNGLLVTAGNAGNCAIEWAQNTSNATGTTVQGGSWMQTRRVA